VRALRDVPAGAAFDHVHVNAPAELQAQRAEFVEFVTSFE